MTETEQRLQAELEAVRGELAAERAVSAALRVQVAQLLEVAEELTAQRVGVPTSEHGRRPNQP